MPLSIVGGIDGRYLAGREIALDEDNNICEEQVKNPQRMQVENIADNSAVKVRLIVKGGNKFTVRVESVKGGHTSGTN